MKICLVASLIAILFFVPDSFAQRSERGSKVTQIGRLAYLSKNTVETDIFDCHFQYAYALRRSPSVEWDVVFLSQLKLLAKKTHDGDDYLDLYKAEEIRPSQAFDRMVQVLKELNDGQGYKVDENGIEWLNNAQKMRGQQFLNRIENISARNRSFYSVSARLGGADGAVEMLAIADDVNNEFVLLGMSSIDNGCF